MQRLLIIVILVYSVFFVLTVLSFFPFGYTVTQDVSTVTVTSSFSLLSHISRTGDTLSKALTELRLLLAANAVCLLIPIIGFIAVYKKGIDEQRKAIEGYAVFAFIFILITFII